MAIGSGLGSSLGVSAESTYGTYVAPARHYRFTSFTVEKVANRVQGEGIQSGSLGPLLSRYAQTTEAATAAFSMDVATTKFGLLLQTLMGTSVTPVQQAATAAYLQTHTLADPLGKFLTVQAGVPQRDGTVVPHTVTGAKVAGATFSAQVGELLKADFTLDGKQFATSQSLATPSYVSNDVFNGSQMTLKMGTYASETAVSGVRGVTISIDRPMDVADYTAGAAGLKAEPVLNGVTNITAQITADFLSKTTFQDIAHSGTSTSLVWEFLGATIASTYKYTFRITLPSVTFEPATQSVGGPGELSQTFNATWRYDGTNLPKIEYISTDTTV